MGQKVNPHGLRVGVIKDWDAKWYAEDDFADNLVEDYNIRKFLKNKLYAAGISKIETERASDRLKIVIHTAKPGIVIGKGGAEISEKSDPVIFLLEGVYGLYVLIPIISLLSSLCNIVFYTLKLLIKGLQRFRFPCCQLLTVQLPS